MDNRNRMVELYCKIKKGTASKDEELEFNILKNSSCLREDVLMESIKRQAKEKNMIK